jgi:2-polyprenyl-3-methyl-5-hydroxy-6-metoxy-1,4-benzoquinol methylase
MSYLHFAKFYDELMKDVPYDLWVRFFEQKVDRHFGKQAAKRILDLGCGTGTIAIELARKNYDVTGIDISEEMLTIAQLKANEERLPVQFFQQDMSQFSGFPAFDCIVVFCDSLNYLQTEAAVSATFSSIYDALEPGGLLLFDVHSVYKLEEVFIGSTFTSNEEDVSFIWHCFEGEVPRSVEHDLSFFVKAGELYERFDEVHLQRTFPIRDYLKMLKETGFDVLEVNGDFQEGEIQPKAERVFFTCRKP